MECVRKSCSELPFTTRSGSDHATLCVFLYQAGPEVIAEGKDIVRVNVTNNDRRYIWARTIREELVRVDQKKVLDPAKTEEMIARQYRTPFDDPVWKCRLLDARTGREIGWKFWNYVDCSDNSAGEKLLRDWMETPCGFQENCLKTNVMSVSTNTKDLSGCSKRLLEWT